MELVGRRTRSGRGEGDCQCVCAADRRGGRAHARCRCGLRPADRRRACDRQRGDPFAVGVDIACRMKLSVYDREANALAGQRDRLANNIESEPVHVLKSIDGRDARSTLLFRPERPATGPEIENQQPSTLPIPHLPHGESICGEVSP